MEELWFEEDLVANTDDDLLVTKMLFDDDPLHPEDLATAVKGCVRVSMPKWELLDRATVTVGKAVPLWKVRLRFQFDPGSENIKFVSARCEAYLEPENLGGARPSVFDLFPKAMGDGEPQTISVAFAPSIKAAGVEVSAGQITTELGIGQVAPIVVGYPGQDDRAPYWLLRSGKHPILGTRDFWLVLEQPPRCDAIRLRVRVEGRIQTAWGPISVGPKERVWAKRPQVIIK